MSRNKEILTSAEDKILGIFKSNYWPYQSICNQIMTIANEFPGVKTDPASFNEALVALQKRGFISTKDNQTYCLTELVVKKIGAVPPAS